MVTVAVFAKSSNIWREINIVLGMSSVVAFGSVVLGKIRSKQFTVTATERFLSPDRDIQKAQLLQMYTSICIICAHVYNTSHPFKIQANKAVET